MRTRRIRAARVLALAAAAVLLSAGHGPIKVGDVAPDFELTLIDGSKVTLGSLRGNVVMLNLWATWCVPCRAELPMLDAYYAIRQKSGLRVFAVTTEDSLPIFHLKKLFAVMHIPSARKLKGPYPPAGGVPTNYIIDRSGRVRYAKAGAFELKELDAAMIPLLREPVPDQTAAITPTR